MPNIPFATDPNNRYKPAYGQPQGGMTGYTGAGRMPRMSRDARMTKLGMMDPAERTGRSVDMGLVSMQDAMANMEAARASGKLKGESAFEALPSNQRRRSRRGY